MAEALVRCGVCDSVATEYCKPCLLILCEGCAKGHSFYSGQHDIEPYWEINVPTFPTICSRHKKYLCTTYCKDCKIPVCKKCSSRKNEHKKHNRISIEVLSKVKEANDTLEKRNSVQPNIEMKESSADEETYVKTAFSSLDITSTEKQISESIKMSYVDKGEIFKVFEETETPLSGNEPENIKKTGSAYENVDFEVQELDCFHGMLPREEAERLLIKDGDFLVRESNDPETNEPCCVLSAYFQDHRHFILKCPDEQKHASKDSHDSILAKVNQFYRTGKPWEDCPDNILKHPIPREQWFIKNDDVVLEMELGKGYFGVVNKGIYKPKDISVAVKTCKETLTQKETKTLLKEGRSLVDYDHPNIVKFIGIAAIRPPVIIVMEYVAGGDLLNHLKKHANTLRTTQLTKMCADAASGMAYLESKNCIHRELAARNCMVGDGLVVKISDFGLSRQKEEHTISDGDKHITWKWSAPEVLLQDTYSSLSDVWSFGILMWEIYSRGKDPFSDISMSELPSKIKEGYKMPAPEGTPAACHDLMMKCWEYNPNERYHFDRIQKKLNSMISSLRYSYVELQKKVS